MAIARTERLIVDYEYGAQSVFALKEAAGGLCEIIWLVDLSTTEMRKLARLMSRLGTVIDVADRSELQIVEELRRSDPTGILSLSDRPGMMMARIAAALGLEFHSPEVAGRLFDKLRQRESLLAGGISCPAWWGLGRRRPRGHRGVRRPRRVSGGPEAPTGQRQPGRISRA